MVINSLLLFGNLLLHFATEIRFNYTIIMTNYKSAPIPSTKMPGGVPYIIGNEAAERFSFYGMKTILVIFMTKYLMDQSGALDVMNREEALKLRVRIISISSEDLCL